MEEFYKDKTAIVYYDRELDTLFLEYLAKVKSEQEFITINISVLAAFKKLNTRKFVADIRKMGVISVGSQNWVIANLLPGMVKHLNGKMLFHAQLVDPSEILSKVSGSNIKVRSSQVAEGFEVVQFSDAEEMKKQLRSIS